jgi:hypothetical protein
VENKHTFGFVCGEFSIALSGNDIVMPGSKNQPLPKSLVPYVAMNDAAGYYTLRARCDGAIVCDMPVHVVWVGHPSQPAPFLGFKTDDPKGMRDALAAFVGKRVELEFTPQRNQS